MTKKVAEASKYKGLSYFHKKGGLEPKGDQLNGIPVHEETYQYDKRGNLTHIYKDGQLVNQYYFGALNRLESAMNYESGLGATYKYNGLGSRVGKVEGTIVALPTSVINQLNLIPTRQIDDIIDLAKQYNNLLQRTENEVTSLFTWDNSALSMDRENQSYQYFMDELGSPIRVTKRVGIEQEIYGYDEFGQNLYVNHKSEQPFGYIGYQRDNVANTFFAQAREYSPRMGRFIAEDFIKGMALYPFTLNHYTYCKNQPMDFVDLNGMWMDGELTPGELDQWLNEGERPEWLIDIPEYLASPEGKITITTEWIIIAAIIGAGTGNTKLVKVAGSAAIGAVFNGTLKGLTGSSWDDFANAYAGGAVQGGLSELLPGAFGKGVAGAVGSAVESIVGGKEVDKEFLYSMALSAITEALSYASIGKYFSIAGEGLTPFSKGVLTFFEQVTAFSPAMTADMIIKILFMNNSGAITSGFKGAFAELECE